MSSFRKMQKETPFHQALIKSNLLASLRYRAPTYQLWVVNIPSQETRAFMAMRSKTIFHICIMHKANESYLSSLTMSLYATMHWSCHPPQLLPLVGFGDTAHSIVLIHWYLPVALYLKLIILIYFTLKHLFILPGNILYFIQFYLPVCIGLPCYKMDHR